MTRPASVRTCLYVCLAQVMVCTQTKIPMKSPHSVVTCSTTKTSPKKTKKKQNCRVADKQLGNIIKNVPELRVCNSGKWLCFLYISNIGWGPSKSFKCIHTLAMRPTLHKLNQSFQACDSSDAIQRLSSSGISCIKTCAPAEFL